MSGRLAGKVAIVTGAGSGLGASSALQLASEGATVVCADIDEVGAQSTAQAISALGGRSEALACDVAREHDNANLASFTLERFGAIDILLANAGISGVGSAIDTTLAAWNHLISINLTGSFLSARAVLPAMIAAGKGSIILQGSISGHTGFEKLAAYSASKGGLLALARQMAVDFAHHNIRVNAIAPGTIKTELVEETYRARIIANGEGPDQLESALQASASRYPLGRLGSVEDVAHMVVFLASDEAKWITGTVFNVDGGYGAA